MVLNIILFDAFFFESRQIFGNAFVFWQFQGLSHIDQATRILVISVLMSLAVLGSITLLFLGNPT